MLTYCNFKWINFQIMRVIHEICTNLRNSENYAMWRHIHSSTENVVLHSARGLNEWRFKNQNTLAKIVPKKNSFCMEINKSSDPKSFL
jgi:hypothetical protein